MCSLLLTVYALEITLVHVISHDSVSSAGLLDGPLIPWPSMQREPEPFLVCQMADVSGHSLAALVLLLPPQPGGRSPVPSLGLSLHQRCVSSELWHPFEVHPLGPAVAGLECPWAASARTASLCPLSPLETGLVTGLTRGGGQVVLMSTRSQLSLGALGVTTKWAPS